ncbi:MAG: hypothetical protein EBQ99_09735 [Planctomycetes bacterium]|nr:hypothetical protein [Planctomycetota bacterium]
MAKLFYTLSEAAERLGKTGDEVTALVEQGKLREFRDEHNNLKLKAEEVNLLAGDSAGSFELDLSTTAPAESDSFELDLSESGLAEPAARSASSSPIGLDAMATEGVADDLQLDLGDSGSAGSPPAAAAPAAPEAEEMTFELDLSGSAAAVPTPPAAASQSAMAAPAGTHDDLTLELDLGDSAPASSAKAGASDELTLELDLDASAAPAAPAKGSDMLDSMGSVAAASAASGLGASAGGSAVDSRMGSAAGSAIGDRVNLEGEGSGSGLMDLTSDSESSSIGAALMDEAFSSDEGAELPANASGIFGGEGGGAEGGAEASAVAAGAAAAAVAVAAAGKSSRAPIFTSAPTSVREAYDGPWSGLGVGLLLPCFLGLLAAAAVMTLRVMGAPAEWAVMFAKDWMMWGGALAGAVLVCGGIGFFVGKATE